MKILIILVLVLLYIVTTNYLYKIYNKNSKFSEKITEIIIVETLGYVFLGLLVLNPNKEYNLLEILNLLQGISFFCCCFFLFYHDYGNTEKEEIKKLGSKKEIFFHFVKKSGKSNIVLSKNKRLLFFLAIYISLEIVKALI